MIGNRNIQDVNFAAELALPAANANASTEVLDFGKTALSPENVEILIGHEAVPGLLDTKKVTATVQDSADGENFAAIAGLATLVSTGAGGVGAVAASRRLRLPSTTRQYVRLNAAVDAVGGDNTAANFYIKGLF